MTCKNKILTWDGKKTLTDISNSNRWLNVCADCAGNINAEINRKSNYEAKLENHFDDTRVTCKYTKNCSEKNIMNCWACRNNKQKDNPYGLYSGYSSSSSSRYGFGKSLWYSKKKHKVIK